MQKLSKEYRLEAQQSALFYNISYSALMIATTVELSKVFDRTEDAIGLSSLFELCKQNQRLFFITKGSQDNASSNSIYNGFFGDYENRRIDLSDKAKHLHEQRCKALVHNDKEIQFVVEAVDDQYPLQFSDLEALTFFALDFTRFVIGQLTGVYKADKPINCNSLETTLELVRLGLEYRPKKMFELYDRKGSH